MNAAALAVRPGARLSTFASQLARRLGQRESDLHREFAESMRTVATATSAGASLNEALAEAAARANGTVSRACRTAASGIELGEPIAMVMARFAESVPCDGALLFARVVVEQHRRSANLAQLCRRVSHLERDRSRLREEAHSATAQARFSARAVIAMPAVVFVLAVMADIEAVRRLAATPLVVLPSLLLFASGAAWVIQISRQARMVTRGMPATSSLRIPVVVSLTTVIMLVITGAGFAAVISIAAVTAWIVLRRYRAQTAYLAQLGDVIASGLLEQSIALLEAGVGPRDTLLRCLHSAPEPARSMFAPSCAEMALGRSSHEALVSTELVRASFAVEAWIDCLLAAHTSGTPALPVLEQMLVDARTLERERFRRVAATAGPRIQMAVVFCIVPGVLWLVLATVTIGLVGSLRDTGVLA